ncbi:MAG: arginine--tRNA ligase [Candidatus Bathyarchaeia archaeon]
MYEVKNVTHISSNPFGEFRNQCDTILQKAMQEAFPDLTPPTLSLNIPPNPEFGELSSSICFELSKLLEKSPLDLATQIAAKAELEKSSFNLVSAIMAEGQGYVNFYVNISELARLTVESARALNTEYGYVKTEKPQRIIVEHTSANPIHPIHIGTSRNTVLGDTLARMLEARGHTVSRHYYIDDVGRQSAVIAYGYNLLGRPKPNEKPDHFIGAVYAITSCLLEIRKLKESIEKADPVSEETLNLKKNLDDWVAVAAELEQKFPKLFNALLEKISEDKNPELKVNQLLREYEEGKEEAKKLIREFSQLCLEGFKQTFARAGVSVDSWDWESNFVWNSDVSRTLEALKRTPFVVSENGTYEFDAEKAAQILDLKKIFNLKENQEIPSLTLGRADGTTLYTTRDIPYSIWKLKQADKVINVIGMEQTLSQLQLKIALCVLGHTEKAKNLIHFSYNLVSFPGQRISGRRGRYVTFDEVMEESTARAYEEVSKRSPELPDEIKRGIAEAVGVGAVKYSLVETDPQKRVIFTWDRVLNFETNSAPYIQYSHARACNILKKVNYEPRNADMSLLKDPLECDLVLAVARFPEIFIDAADNLKPTVIAEYSNALADKFNAFYASLPVIRAETPELSNARLMIVEAVRITLRNALRLIGIEAPERM